MSLNSAVLKVFHDYKTESEKRTVFSTSLIFVLMCALCFLAVIFFNTDFLSQLLVKTNNYAFFLKIVLGSVFFNLFRLFGLAYLRALEKPVHYSTLNIIHFTLLVSLNIYHVLFLKQSIFGVVKSSFFASGFLFLVIALTVFRNIGFAFSFDILKKLLHFGMPMMPGVIAGWILTVSDRYLLNWFASPAEVGLYDIAYKFGIDRKSTRLNSSH